MSKKIMKSIFNIEKYFRKTYGIDKKAFKIVIYIAENFGIEKIEVLKKER